jgi:Fe-S-cluster-containing hydrogenase component 2
MGQEASGFWLDIVPRVDPERCRHCADCAAAAACLVGGFRRDDPENLPFVREEICFGCYSCAGACPNRAIILPRRT